MIHSTIDIGSVRLKVLVADTPSLREHGLSGRPNLIGVDGMLFVFDRPTRDNGLWMADMQFPLDIIWVGYPGIQAQPSLEVVDITQNAQPDSYPHTFHSQSPAQFAVEVPAGFVEQHHIAIGDRVVGS